MDWKKAPKKLVVINDVAGFGRCSTSVALPIISALGVQACLAPTALFSNHTGFPTWHMDDYTERLPLYLHAWEQLGLSFDGIYVGFLGSDVQAKIVKEFVALHPESMILIDPVLGDHGKTYKTVTPSHCECIKELVSSANIITPNITEACILTDTPFKESGWTEAELENLARKLLELGPTQGVITGIHESESFVNFYYESQQASLQTGLFRCPICGQSRPGTGDIFASILAADILNSMPLSDCVTKAASFISTCIAGSEVAGIPVREGVCFENYLCELIHK